MLPSFHVYTWKMDRECLWNCTVLLLPEQQVRKPESHSAMPMQSFLHILSLWGYSTQCGISIQPLAQRMTKQTNRQIWVSAEQLHCDLPSVPLGTGAQPWPWPQVTPSTQNTLGSPGGASLWTGESTTITTFRPLMDMQSQGHKDNHLNSKFLTPKEKLRKYPHTSTLENYSWSCILKKYWFYSQSVWYISVQRLINSYHRKSKFLKSHRSIVERGVPTEHSHIQMYKTYQDHITE